jgi:glycerate dehydrogenase
LTERARKSRSASRKRTSCCINKVELTARSLAGARKLKLIALAATGTDNVDLAAAEERGIAVCNVRGYCTASVVQHAWAMILSLTQHLRL